MVAPAAPPRHMTVMVKQSNLDDPRTAAFAWGRYKALMRWMGIAALVAVVVSLAALRYLVGPGVSIHMMIATSAGVGISVLLAAALMGLVFLSSGSGHDDAIENPLEDELNR